MESLWKLLFYFKEHFDVWLFGFGCGSLAWYFVLKHFDSKINLINNWENIARRKWIDSEKETDIMGRRLIEHGAMCYQNCARELREVLLSHKEKKT